MRVVEQGGGQVVRARDGWRLVRPAARSDVYTNAQLGDPIGHAGWRPPVTLTVRARFSHPVDQLRGTAGFGFWNEAFAPGRWLPRPPRAVWFFAAGPPHNVPLALGVPGRGFKAATLDAGRPAFFALLPTAPMGFLLMRFPPLYRRLWPIAQQAIGAQEVLLTRLDPTAEHEYAVHWKQDQAIFTVDGEVVLRATSPPGGPLHLVAWIDNSYAVATPQGQFRLGTVDAPEAQWLELVNVTVEC